MISEPGARHLVWLDGEFVPWGDAKMHVSDHHYGIGVFEGLRAYHGARGTFVFRLEDHTKRLFRSARILKMQVPNSYGEQTLNMAQIELMRRNELADAYVRPFVFYGGMLGLSPRTQDLTVHVAILALGWKGGAYAGDAPHARGVSLRTASLLRNHPNSVFSKAKANGNYVNGILARQEAQSSGADDALMLDQNGFVTETSGANVFIVRDGVVLTPPLSSVLEGITRHTVIELAARAGFTVIERNITRDDVYVADEVFLTGTAVEVTPVREVDGRRVGTSAEGSVTKQLREMYAAEARGEGDYQRLWLTRV